MNEVFTTSGIRLESSNRPIVTFIIGFDRALSLLQITMADCNPSHENFYPITPHTSTGEKYITGVGLIIGLIFTFIPDKIRLAWMVDSWAIR